MFILYGPLPLDILIVVLCFSVLFLTVPFLSDDLLESLDVSDGI
jgi:hypothetical protein